MKIHTAKGTHHNATFQALATWQASMQGAFPAILIGDHSVDVDDLPETRNAYAQRVADALEDVLHTLRTEAAKVGDEAQVALVSRALDGDVNALEACCEAIEAGQG